MPIPSQKDIPIPLLRLIHCMGGEVKPRVVYSVLAEYFRLTEEEREEILPSGLSRKFNNRVRCTRNSLCDLGLLDRSTHGIWKITDKGRKELSRLGLIDKPFSIATSLQHKSLSTSNKGTKELKSDNEEILELVLEEVAPNGPKKFPEDFLDNNCPDFYEVELPGTPLHLAPLSQTIITSPGGYFRYQAKNPSAAKYILYAHKVGLKNVKIPQDNLVLFRAVISYEKYCDEIIKQAFDLFLEFTYDESRAETLVNEVAKKLNLRAKRNQE